ncbi:MAG: protein kinase [Gammaproteobacteria bacterium]|nr:protein kinase [Gammaproteobacteria bacterium]
MARPTKPKFSSFDLPMGRVIAKKYEILSKLGGGWEGEVYKILETSTGIERAAKFFYPHRNENNRTSNFNAKKLHQLRLCPILIQYHTKEDFVFKRVPVTVLISEYVEGQLLSEFIKTFPGKRLTPYQALHLLHALTKGIECIHDMNEYHGDLHSDNIIVNKFGLNFDLKLVDLFSAKESKSESRKFDIVTLIQVFHESLGGAKHYAKHPDAIKYICCGLKSNLILKKFKTVGQLRRHIESMDW